MIHLELPAGPVRPLPFYLAMEEWAAANLPPEEYFFAWRVEPTVICGRNQDIGLEVNTEYCRNEGIAVVRRRSGGGSVYADMNNWMMSYIAPGDDVTIGFGRYTTAVCAFLASLGIDGKATGRNDIVVSGAKIAGNAFYHLPGRSIVHGTLLCDTDTERMSRALTPSRAKLASKGVKSVSSRVTSLRNAGYAGDIATVGPMAAAFMCDRHIVLTGADIAAIETLQARYSDPGYFRGRGHSDFSGICRREHIDGVGEFEARIRLDGRGNILTLDLGGDFFVSGDVSAMLSSLRGIPYTPAAIAGACGTTDCSAIHGLTAENLTKILIETKIP